MTAPTEQESAEAWFKIAVLSKDLVAANDRIRQLIADVDRLTVECDVAKADADKKHESLQSLDRLLQNAHDEIDRWKSTILGILAAANNPAPIRRCLEKNGLNKFVTDNRRYFTKGSS